MKNEKQADKKELGNNMSDKSQGERVNRGSRRGRDRLEHVLQ